MHTYIHTYHALTPCAFIYIYIYIYIYTHTHKNIHTYIHTYVRIYMHMHLHTPRDSSGPAPSTHSSLQRTFQLPGTH